MNLSCRFIQEQLNGSYTMVQRTFYYLWKRLSSQKSGWNIVDVVEEVNTEAADVLSLQEDMQPSTHSDETKSKGKKKKKGKLRFTLEDVSTVSERIVISLRLPPSYSLQQKKIWWRKRSSWIRNIKDFKSQSIAQTSSCKEAEDGDVMICSNSK